jgi:hypothetical protein
MDPKEFSWSEDQQVTVTNPTAKPYKFMVHGKAYEVGAGKTVKMPGYIAWVYVYGQSVKAMQDDGTFTSLNDEGFKQTYYEKFVAGVDSVIQQVQEVEPEVNTFEDVSLDTQEDEPVPAPGTGVNYTPKRGRPANAAKS